MNRVPLVVVGGYLGAGKTTLIRHLLTRTLDRRLLILVNDFGTISIDAGLIAEANGDTIALSNGCLCCAMTGDLYYAIGDALDRRPRPDAIVVEASGVADPARIATLALAEPELQHAGVVTVADGAHLPELLDDPLIGPQVARQIAAADLIALSRTDLADPAPALERIAALTPAPVVPAPNGDLDPDLIFGLDAPAPQAPGGENHDRTFAKWSTERAGPASAQALDDFLKVRPPGLFRLKGWITDETGTSEIHRVGGRLEKRRAAARQGSWLVAIGPAALFDPDEMECRWQKIFSHRP
jgi:G3E family GTPase